MKIIFIFLQGFFHLRVSDRLENCSIFPVLFALVQLLLNLLSSDTLINLPNLEIFYKLPPTVVQSIGLFYYNSYYLIFLVPIH